MVILDIRYGYSRNNSKISKMVIWLEYMDFDGMSGGYSGILYIRIYDT